MAYELFYTSSRKGLDTDVQGLVTVGMTEGMQAHLRALLESLSGYQLVYRGENADQNPVLYAHWILPIEGFSSVLSRICYAGSDFTGRSNILAHHIAVRQGEQCPAGPAWVMMQPDVMARTWFGEPRFLSEEKAIPSGQSTVWTCKEWQAVTGDAGWAGVLAESVISNERTPVHVLYKPGQAILPLLNEALALLPEATRWNVSFSTHFHAVAKGIGCDWRFCLEGTREARTLGQLPTDSTVIDLTNPGQPPPSGHHTTLARTGWPSDVPKFVAVLEDITRVEADLLLVKYAQAFYGVDALVVRRLNEHGVCAYGELQPGIGESVIVETRGAIAAKRVMLIGTLPLEHFGKAEMQELARLSIRIIKEKKLPVATVVSPIHGRMYGICAEDSLESLVRGFILGLRDWPGTAISNIMFADKEAETAGVLQRHLEELMREAPTGKSGSTGQKMTAVFDGAVASHSPSKREHGRPSVFISACSKDYELARKVYNYLVEHSIEAFFSPESLPQIGVSDYRKKIDEVLDYVEHMIVVTSSLENVMSPWVEAEWGLFINEKRCGRKSGNLVTIIGGGISPASLPPSLRYFEVIPFDPSSFARILRYTGSTQPKSDAIPDPKSRGTWWQALKRLLEGIGGRANKPDA